MTERVLYGYWRSSASYRVRIALALKGLAHAQIPVSLLGGAQRAPAFLAHNPQGLVPVLQDGEQWLTQSLAICEYLDEAYPDTVRLLPADPFARARVRGFALAVACELHPLNNLRVLQYLTGTLGVGEPDKLAWIRHWMATGLAALEAMLAGEAGRCCFGDAVSLADICLVPQLYNARRFEVDLAPYPHLVAVDAYLQSLPAFAAAHPAEQADAT